MPEDGIECESFTFISTNSFLLMLVYENKYCLLFHLDNFAYKTVDKQMKDYLDDNLFETGEDYFFYFDK